MKNSVKIILAYLFMLSPLLKAQAINQLLSQAIEDSAEESWEYSASGGYVFEAEMNLTGDDKPEKMVWFSIDGYGSIHIFDSSSEQKYLGKLDRRLLGSPMIKEADKSTIFSISDSGNYPSEGEEAFTKKVLSTVISKNGIETLVRVAGVGSGDIEDIQFNQILNGSMSLEGVTNFEPSIRFTSLRSYLNDEDNWAEFRQAEWVEVDSYLVHRDDVEMVRKIKELSDENEIKNLLGDFTKSEALKLLGNLEPRSKRESQKEKAEPEKKSSNLPWIIGGVILLGMLFFLLKTFKGKSKP